MLFPRHDACACLLSTRSNGTGTLYHSLLVHQMEWIKEGYCLLHFFSWRIPIASITCLEMRRKLSSQLFVLCTVYKYLTHGLSSWIQISNNIPSCSLNAESDHNNNRAFIPSSRLRMLLDRAQNNRINFTRKKAPTNVSELNVWYLCLKKKA